MKSFRSVPGPRSFIAFQSLTGSFKHNELHKVFSSLYKKYGPIVRQKVLPGVNLLLIYDPEDIAVVANDFNKKNDFPSRADHFPLIKYRQDRPDVYSNAGLLPTNGPEWWRLRSALQKNLSKPVYIRKFIPEANKIIEDFTNALDKTTARETPVDIERYLANLNLELIVFLTFGVRANALTEKELRPGSYSSDLIAAAYEANSLTLKLDQQLPVWKIWNTATYKRYSACMDKLHEEGKRLLKLWEERSGEEETCLMDDYAKDPQLTRKDLQGTAEDFLLAGTDTTSITMSMVLYHVARNPEVQQKIVEEIDSLGENSEITSEVLNNLIPYTRAVLKESLRLNPISVGFGRLLTKDMEIRGYHIPKKTMVVTQNFVACRLPGNFYRPLDFIPDRWLKTQKKETSIHSHLVLPFGHGMRACIARRFAEQNMLLTLLKMVRKYKISYAGPPEEIEIETLLVNRPKYPVQLFLKPRN